MKNRLEQIINLKLNNFEIKPPKQDEYIEPNPCENGYEAIGLKEKDGKMVPNCVPIKEEQKKVNLADYPWDKCVADQIERYGDEEIAKRVCGAIKALNAEREQMKIKKEGFPVPSPEGNEDENTFVSRCISELYDEYGQEQASAICYSKWREK